MHLSSLEAYVTLYVQSLLGRASLLRRLCRKVAARCAAAKCRGWARVFHVGGERGNSREVQRLQHHARQLMHAHVLKAICDVVVRGVRREAHIAVHRPRFRRRLAVTCVISYDCC